MHQHYGCLLRLVLLFLLVLILIVYFLCLCHCILIVGIDKVLFGYREAHHGALLDLYAGLPKTALHLFLNGDKRMAMDIASYYWVDKRVGNGAKATSNTTTISRHDFNGHLHTSMTAHPKLDPITGELLDFRYSILPPFLIFFLLDHLGRKLSDIPIFDISANPPSSTTSSLPNVSPSSPTSSL
ncbi:hypothetical protein J5N97_020986 [Dioscorea zingiberensis]|uniref:Uncharacterized protein n=1 Tax=Dioscorea zingiberensis TaxID=325984 RepID=A0A9D5CGS9_9LILI|nr:hypothetical protein J5N97_020986 [Dioscorea zingiberensis]